MGLYCEFYIADLGCPDIIEQEVEGQIFSAIPNYGPACDAFVDTFLNVAYALVPVDTGYLMGSIGAGVWGEDACYAEALAEYAEYVEYGTSYMSAQPYFEPALEEAVAICAELAGQAVNEAQQIVNEQIEAFLASLMDAAMAAASGGKGMMDTTWGEFFGGLATFAIAAIVLFPIMVYAYGIADTIASGLTGQSATEEWHVGGAGFPIVEII